MKSVKGQDLVDQVLELYARRVTRDKDLLVKSMAMVTLRLVPDLDEDTVDGALCAIYARSVGKIASREYTKAWEEISPKTFNSFIRCYSCKEFGKGRHTLNCPVLQQLEDRQVEIR